MVGLPASGKSTYAKELSEKTGAVICSSDALRKELYGDENEQGDSHKVFEILHKRIKEHLSNGQDVIYDATNISSKRRRHFLSQLSKVEYNKECVIMATPYEKCLENNRNRDRVVPEEVIKKMYMSWNTPYFFEGWDNIAIVRKEEDVTITPEDFVAKTWQYDQRNSHHSLSLGQHCSDARVYIDRYFLVMYPYRIMKVALLDAASIHDCGKEFTATFRNCRGEETSECHFYNHENTGAYEALFFNYGHDDALTVSILVNLHMCPYQWEKSPNTEKLQNKYKKLWGDNLYDSVMLLHEADVDAH